MRKPGTIGRPRVKGPRLPGPADRVKDPATPWRRVTLAGWYGRGERRLDIASGTAVWHHPGRQVAIRWVLVRDAEGEKEPQAFPCTDPGVDPVYYDKVRGPRDAPKRRCIWHHIPASGAIPGPVADQT